MGLLVFEAGDVCEALSPFSPNVLVFPVPRSEQSLFWDLFRREQLVSAYDSNISVVYYSLLIIYIVVLYSHIIFDAVVCSLLSTIVAPITRSAVYPDTHCSHRI